MMDDREELARQLAEEHRAGRAADELDRQMENLVWDFEGWTADGRLQLYITGSGLHLIPADDVVRLANAMLAEHEIYTREEE